MLSETIVLSIWPPSASALSVEPACVAALFHLQLAIPGRFSVAYTANPDQAPSGQLPYLTHGLHNVSSLTSIVHYVKNLPGALDVDGSFQKAQSAARIAHVQTTYGDLLTAMLYSIDTNWWNVTRPAIVSALPVPQCYYVPERLRNSYRPRLEAAEMWNISSVDQDDKENVMSAFRKDKRKNKQAETQRFKTVFARDKAAQQAREFLSIYERFLGEDRFFYSSERPTSLDIIFAAHTHILAQLPFTDNLLQSVLVHSFPTILAHARAVQSAILENAVPPIARSNPSSSIMFLIPLRISSLLRKPRVAHSVEDGRYTVARWGWISLAITGVALYFRLYRREIREAEYEEDVLVAHEEMLEEEDYEDE
ncbi:uncharacterized protein FIBRA_04157 [Fibroporia radiculosa]|uniref:Mitochondrial outer membrane transport complex Sam37/metaxin N-terminal domain-containing protein n=1 Tax=Fibroporia radiculosa TaxID=599839 RepID=J4GNY4_9APHY|nr:uncharacterized protein FIBRA_04157 [Fibroporia radiculosa]CCM02080.1 predicted protein [Fibroporia radiculosa]